MPTFKNTVNGAGETAIVGTSTKHHGVAGESKDQGAGVLGVSKGGEGVSGFSKSGTGVVGQSDQATGVRGLSKPGRGVEGLSSTGDGVVGNTDSGVGVSGSSSTGHGVAGLSESASGVRGVSKSGRGVEGWSESAYGVSGDSTRSAGVRGTSVEGRGVEGWTTRSEGVFGISVSGTGVQGISGRSRFARPFDSEVIDGIFRLGSSAKQWATPLSADQVQQTATSKATERDRQQEPAAHADKVSERAAESSPMVERAVIESRPILDSISTDVVVADPIAGVSIYDDAAGVGVWGEHRGGGVGVKAVSQDGIGVLANSDTYEAVHAETRSPNTAAIAAYNSNPRGTGAAIYAKKTGTRGHAGFFDGKVWVTGELGVGGDIVLANADCAEDFDVAPETTAAPGTVMVVNDAGVLEPSRRAYDKCVVGVISGAGDYRPALILDKQAASEHRAPVALMGKVCCMVTAEFGAIEAGDLLTTSPVAGHAMSTSEPAKAFGAVIGKALRPLRSGRGLIPILVALQ